MIPTHNTRVSQPLKRYKMPGKTYALHGSEEIYGSYDDKAALEQTIYKILNTERFKYLIYSWNFGVEFQELIGKSVSYACPEIERRIREALSQDSRILSLSEFLFDTGTKGSVAVTFTITSLFSSFSVSKVVSI